MSRLGALVAALLVAAMPLWTESTTLVVSLSVAAGALLLVGILRPSLPAASLGGGIAAAGYALALWSSAAPAGIVEPLAFAIALLLALRHADFAETFQGADVAPAIAGAAFQRWIVTSALAVAGVIVLTAAVTLLADGAPPVFRPLLAGAGAFLALTAAVAALGFRPKGR